VNGQVNVLVTLACIAVCIVPCWRLEEAFIVFPDSHFSPHRRPSFRLNLTQRLRSPNTYLIPDSQRQSREPSVGAVAPANQHPTDHDRR